MDSYYTTEEAATLKGCTQRYIRLLFNTGKITGRKVNKNLILLDKDSIDNLIVDNRQRGRTAKKEK